MADDKITMYNRNKKFIIKYCNYDKRLLGNTNKLVDYNIVMTDINNILHGPVRDYNIFKKKETEKKNELQKLDFSNLTNSNLIRRIILFVKHNPVFWRLVKKLNCYDRDEYTMNIHSIDIYSTGEKEFLLEKINSIFIYILTLKLKDIPVLDGINSIDYNNFMTHIIFKGAEFYMAIILNPEMSLYLCDQFYPIHDWLNS